MHFDISFPRSGTSSSPRKDRYGPTAFPHVRTQITLTAFNDDLRSEQILLDRVLRYTPDVQHCSNLKYLNPGTPAILQNRLALFQKFFKFCEIFRHC